MASLALLPSSARTPPISQPFFLLPELNSPPLPSPSSILRAAAPSSLTRRRLGKSRSFVLRTSLCDSPIHAARSQHHHDQEPHETPAMRRRSIWINPDIPRRRHDQEPKEEETQKKYSLWVNPDIPPIPLRRGDSPYDSRYVRLAILARSLDAIKGSELGVSELLSSCLGSGPSESDAIVVLNSLENPESALLALRWFQEKIVLKSEVVLYNIALKVFRKFKDWDGFSSLLGEMLGRGVKPDNVTFSTAITCAMSCDRPATAVEWFQRMPEFGCSPDMITSSVMIDALSRTREYSMALELYARAQVEKWSIRAGAYATVMRVYTMLGDFDGALKVFDEMKTLGVKPNLSVYNALLVAMGKARRPWLVKATYREMEAVGLSPDRRTYSSLLLAFGGARYGKDALSVYRRAKEEGVEFEMVVYNMILAMCADLGFVNEAVEIFEDIKKLPGDHKPDSWSYSSIISAYSIAGEVSELERALKETREAGFEPNIAALTSVIMCYGKVGRTDDVVLAVDMLLELGMTPDESFCSCLLNVMTQTPAEGADKLIGCIVKSHAQLGSLVRLLVDENSSNEVIKGEAEALITGFSKEAKKTFCNFLIDICVTRGFLERACVLLDIALLLDIYFPLQSKTSKQWSLNLHGLSSGAAFAALHVWMIDLHKAIEKGEEFPPVLGINTGLGNLKLSKKRLAFESHLRELKAPFHEAPDKIDWFLTTKTAAETWLKSSSPELVPA